MFCVLEFRADGISILGHMHLDHAGGLDMFIDRKDVEIWVHDKELRSAFWSVATGADVGVYMPHYMQVSSPFAISRYGQI